MVFNEKLLISWVRKDRQAYLICQIFIRCRKSGNQPSDQTIATVLGYQILCKNGIFLKFQLPEKFPRTVLFQ